MKILLFLAQGVETMEMSVFIDVMGWARHDFGLNTEVTTCSLHPEITSSFGLPMRPEKRLNQVDPAEFDALAIPGGFEDFGFYEDAFHPDFLQLIREFDARGKWIASICVGALPVGKSGVLAGRRATTYPLMEGLRQKQLAAFGACVVQEPVVVDRNVITSHGPQTSPQVAFTLLERLTSPADARRVRTAMGF